MSALPLQFQLINVVRQLRSVSFTSNQLRACCHITPVTNQKDHIELSVDFDVSDYQQELDKALEDMKQEYVQNLSLRTNIGMYGKLPVKTPDGSFPLNQIASIIQKSPSLVVVNLAKNSHYQAEVLTTLRNSGMNLNPQQEGQSIVYLTIPKVSREHREQLAKSAKAIFNKAKDSLNKVYTKFSKKTSSINREDEKHLADQKLLAMKHEAQVTAEKLLKAKTDELLKTSE